MTDQDHQGRRPAVSVIIRTYNREELLPRAVESALAQTFSDFEIIIVDDGSTDGTAAYIASIKDPRVRCVTLPEHRGASVTGNRGFESARAEWVANLDSDDIWFEHKLERQMALAAECGDDVGVIYSEAEIGDAATGEIGQSSPVWPDGDVLEPLLSRRWGINFSTVAIRKKYLDALQGFDEAMPRGADKDLMIRLARVCKFASVDEVLARSYINHGPHLRGDRANTIIYRELLLKKLLQWPEVPGKYLALEYRSLAELYTRSHEYGHALRCSLRAIQKAPASPKAWLGVPAFAISVMTLGKFPR